MPIIGTHESITGGFHRAAERARAVGSDCVQVFVTPPRRWPTGDGSSDQSTGQGKPRQLADLTDEEVDRFRTALAANEVVAPLTHASYLINLASPDNGLWRRSIDSFVAELLRSERLGIPAVVIHPGAFTTSSESLGLQRMIAALKEVESQTCAAHVVCLLETTAGQGSTLGHRFEHLATVLDALANPSRFGVCVDTCHLFAAGYALDTRKAYQGTMRQLQQTIGRPTVRAIHLNDSQQPQSSRKDRHAHIGHGEMGLDPFRHLLNDSHFAQVPMYLETDKGQKGKRSWDEINLRTLRKLVE